MNPERIAEIESSIIGVFVENVRPAIRQAIAAAVAEERATTICSTGPITVERVAEILGWNPTVFASEVRREPYAFAGRIMAAVKEAYEAGRERGRE